MDLKRVVKEPSISENRTEMEAESSSHFLHSSHKTLDKEAMEKHTAMLHRFSSRKVDKSRSSPDSESRDTFMSRFSELKNDISSVLSRGDHLKSDLDEISTSVTELEKLVSEKSYFLTSYELRSSLNTVSDLKRRLGNLNTTLVPRKKFSLDVKNSNDGRAKDRESVRSPKMKFKIPEAPGLRDRENALLVRNVGVRDLGEGEYSISDLRNCEVRLIGTVSALFIHRVENCRIYAGPVAGSVLVEEADGCVFSLASHQVRIHLVRRSDFYIRIRSRPMIEDCSGVRFAPYNLFYDGIEHDLEGSGLAEEIGTWKNVDDFKWLRAAVQSPNWCVIPDIQRRGVVDISSGTESHNRDHSDNN